MAMEANAANAAGSLQRVQRLQTTGSTDAVTRRGDGAASSPFAKETNVSIRNSIADLSSVLGRISQGQEDSVEVLPDSLQKVIRNVMESSFSLSATLEEGLGSTTESQRFSLEQLGTLSRMLTQLGALAEKGVAVSDFSESMQTLLQNLKSLLTVQEGGSSLEPALLNKLSFQLLDARALEDLPVALQQALALLAQMQPQSGQATGDAGSFDFLKSLVQYFMPRPDEEGAAAALGEQALRQDSADAEGEAKLPAREAGEGGAKAAQQAGNGASAARQQAASQGMASQEASAENAAPGKNAAQGETAQSARGDSAPQQGAKGAQAGLLPNAEDGTAGAARQENLSDSRPADGKGQVNVPQGQGAEASKEQASAPQQGDTAQQKAAGPGTDAGRQGNAPQGQGEAQQQKAPSQGTDAESRGQASEQALRGNVQDGKPPETMSARQEPQGMNPQPTRQEGTQSNMAQERQAQQGQNPAQTSTGMQGEAKSATRQAPVLQNTPQLMQSLKDTASFLLKNMPLTERDTALLRDFVNNGQRLLPDKDAKQLQLLLRLSQNNVPAAVNQAAVQKNLGDLPRLWAFMQLCDMTAVKDMKAQQLKRAGRDVAEFAASMKRSMEGGSLFQTDGKGNTHRSLNFMLPLYMGEGEKQSFPAYANVYNEEKYSPEDGRMHKETWLRLCVLTDHIGAVELTCQVYDAKSLNMRVLFSEVGIVEEFKSYIPEFKASFRDMTLELADLKVSVAGSKE